MLIINKDGFLCYEEKWISIIKPSSISACHSIHGASKYLNLD